MDDIAKLKQLIEEEISKEDTNYQETAREINSLSLRNFYDGIDKDIFLLYLCELGYLKLNINGNKKVDIGEKSISLDLGLYFKDTLFNGKENKILMFPLKAKLEFIGLLKDFDFFKEKYEFSNKKLDPNEEITLKECLNSDMNFLDILKLLKRKPFVVYASIRRMNVSKRL